LQVTILDAKAENQFFAVSIGWTNLGDLESSTMFTKILELD